MVQTICGLGENHWNLETSSTFDFPSLHNNNNIKYSLFDKYQTHICYKVLLLFVFLRVCIFTFCGTCCG